MYWLVLGGAVNLSLAGVLLYLILMRLRPTDPPAPAAAAPPPSATAVEASKSRESSPPALAKPNEHEQRRRWLENLATRVDGDIGLHSYRIE
ncbi:MAG: hypothetical protein ACREJM_09465, partial [Candidatus Saccharimonadales bacterium]